MYVQRTLQRYWKDSFFKLRFSTNWQSNATSEPLRIAVVGGGVAGLSSALHLADLVEGGMVSSIDIYPGKAIEKREIGVGVWSTALLPFAFSSRDSHRTVWENFLERGKWLEEVGYRSPSSGSWLARSTLPIRDFEKSPGLLFLRESDLVDILESALSEKEENTVRICHAGVDVKRLSFDSCNQVSAPLQLENGIVSKTDYHLIIAADGTNSALRLHYDHEVNSNTSITEKKAATMIEDRHYAVLRANAPMTIEELGCNGISFQTWGEGQSMRFATVPLVFSKDNKPIERQVWFATTNSKSILNETDPHTRKDKLIESFKSWHDPICTMMEATSADDIIMEHARAHKTPMQPITNFQRFMKHPSGSAVGPGPSLVYVGDSFMTVDPILAQGFTLALEGAHALRQSVGTAIIGDPSKQIDPYLLKKTLLKGNKELSPRYTSLLRATELVQALGQPHNSLTGFVCKNMIRPAMQLAPDSVKTPIFNAIMKYSLGL